MMLEMMLKSTLHSVPSLILIFGDSKYLLFDRFLTFNIAGQSVRLLLRGMIYGAYGHFTCGVVQIDGYGSMTE